MAKFHLTTPVVLIIFNRPDTTEKVFAEIRKARPTKLFIISDAPRLFKEGEPEQCIETRRIVENVDWECAVYRNYAETNLGCKMRISSGLDWVFDQVEEAIILEDDCVPHPSFFRFCQELLERYRCDERVMMITGTNHQVSSTHIEASYFFSKHYVVWGWATWGRAYRGYDVTMQAWNRNINFKMLRYLCSDWLFAKSYEQMFNDVKGGKLNSWAIPWVLHCLFNNGMCIVSRTNLITNIGIVGTHSEQVSESNNLKTIGIDFELVHPEYVYADFRYDNFVFKNRLQAMVIKTEIKLILSQIPILKDILPVIIRGVKAVVRTFD